MNISISTQFVFAVLLSVLSVGISAQDDRLPSFDSFSYLRDPLFSKQGGIAEECPALEPVAPVKAVAQAPGEQFSCPEQGKTAALSQNERFELQLALDKALSQILKLTVDYEALRTRVENVNFPDDQDADGWFSFSDSSTEDEGKLQELLALNAKRIADRDEQIAVLSSRLDALQSRFDSENVSRLLAEKRLKVDRDKSKKSRNKMTATNEKLQLLTKQLEANQATIRQLKIDLTAEKLKLARQANNPVQKPDDLVQEATVQAVDEQFSPAREWVVEGLQFLEGAGEIERDSVTALEPLIKHMQQNETMAIQVNGYTDNVGSVASNLKLSQTRADAVANYLINQGIASHRVKALGYGERRPVASNDTEQGRQQNRRVAILLLE